MLSRAHIINIAVNLFHDMRYYNVASTFRPRFCCRYSYEVCEEELNEFNLNPPPKYLRKINVDASKIPSKGQPIDGNVMRISRLESLSQRQSK